MTGGGFGGSAIALVPRSAAGPVGDAVGRAFEQNGFRAPTVYPVTAADGAAREPYPPELSAPP
jgi:galactokinase